MPDVPSILVIGFVILALELARGISAIVKHIDQIGAQLTEMGKQFDSSDSNSFASDLRGWLSDIEQEIRNSAD